MAPKLSKLKPECLKCSYFNEKLGQGQQYKCAVTGRCPGVDWSREEKIRALLMAKAIQNIGEKGSHGSN